jgi:hypothetical protein
MERIKSVVRVCKAASKRPHSRSNADINHIAAETQSITLLTREGPAVHRELCHVLQTLDVSQMQSVRLPGEFKSGIMVYVSDCTVIASILQSPLHTGFPTLSGMYL